RVPAGQADKAFVPGEPESVGQKFSAIHSRRRRQANLNSSRSGTSPGRRCCGHRVFRTPSSCEWPPTCKQEELSRRNAALLSAFLETPGTGRESSCSSRRGWHFAHGLSPADLRGHK